MGGICGNSNGEIIRCSVKASYLVNNMDAMRQERIGGIVGETSDTVSQCSVNFFDGVEKTIDNNSYHSSIYSYSDTQYTDENIHAAGGIVGYSDNAWVNNCKYDGQSIIMNYVFSDHNAARKYVLTGGIEGKGNSTNKCFSKVDGIIYSAASRVACAGGITGDGIKGSNLVSISDKVSSFLTYNSGQAMAGDIYATNALTSFENVSSNSSMELAGDINYTAGTKRPLSQIKRASFLRTVFGPEYQSLAHLEEDPEAVWVIKDGEYPELYFTVLNDITVSDVEHGTISVDKTQAVDDEIVSVTAIPDEGYKLNKIYVNGEEIPGTTFPVAGDSDVYATFAEIPAEYRVSVAANANASAGLVNVDDTANTMSLQSVSLFSDNSELSATDGEEIKVNTQAAADYTVDAIYVNGEELAGDSFIVTDDSVVTMDALV